MNMNAAPSAHRIDTGKPYQDRAVMRDLNEAAHRAVRQLGPGHEAYGPAMFIMRHSDALVDEFAGSGSLRASLPHPDELADMRRGDAAAAPPMIGVVLLILIGAVVLAAFWLFVASLDWRAVLDFIAPTAAQARDAGWVALSEGR